MNSVQLIGRLTADPTLKTVGERVVCEMRIAVDRGPAKGTDFINVHAWGKVAETCAKHLTKGRLVGIDGRLRQEQWTTEAGNRERVIVVAGQVRFLDRLKTITPEEREELAVA